MLLGIDVGTSSTKVIGIDAEGRTVASASAAYDTDRPRDGWTQQDPALWWQAALAALATILRSGSVNSADIRAVGLSGQMHGAVFLDRRAIDQASKGEIQALRPAILWNDQRTIAQCQEIEQALGGPAELVKAVGNRALTGFTLPKLLWLRAHEPAAYQRLAAMVLPKDYIRLQLTGTVGTDVGDASGTLLLDPDRREWNSQVCKALGIDPSILPPLTESAELVGAITPWAAAQTGLRPGTPVVAGTGDNQAGAVGAGVVTPGLAMASLGTSGVVYVHSTQPRRDLAVPSTPGRVHTLCAADGTAAAVGEAGGVGGAGGWCITGCMLSAAGSLHWARDTIAPSVPFETLIAECSSIPPGSGGLVFLPHLSGERCPYPDPLARGTWFGLRAHHTRAHLIRAVLEGVTLTMAQMLTLIRSLPTPIHRIRLSGGGNQSPLWRQMQADIYGLPVATVNNDEGAAYGAALLAGVGIGAWSNIAEACTATIREQTVHDPHPASAAAYAELAALFDTLYTRFSPAMHALSRFAE